MAEEARPASTELPTEAPAAVSSASGVGSKRKRSGPAELRPEKLAEFEAAEKRKGVVYIGRVPPYMKPIKMKQLLEPYGDIGRIYLAPEDPAAQKRRIAAGGNKKPMFVEGWVEFVDKKDAKFAVATLNTQPMGGNKRDFYGSDLWVLKYLHGFKWHHLTEKIAYEGRIRAQKLRVELAAAKKEAEHYIGRAELAKKLEHRDRAGAGGSASGKSAGGKGRAAEGATDAEGSTADPRFAKKPRRGDDEGRDSRFGGASSSGDAAPRGEVGEDGLRRHFKQRAPLEDKLLTRKGR